MSSPPIGRRALLREGATILSKAGIDGAEQEARFLLCDAEGLTSSDIALAPEATVENAALYRDWIARRAKGEPSSRITGFRDFRGLNFAVTPATLDPRLDSEVLVDAVLEVMSKEDPAVLVDAGTGTGCLILSVLAERPHAVGIGLDLSPDAALVASGNAKRLELDHRFLAVAGNWFESIAPESADVVLSNPPYIRREEIQTLDHEVRAYDPVSALDGGADGLDCYRDLLPQAMRTLKLGGSLAVEIGWDQGSEVQDLMLAEGFLEPRIICDLADRDRVVIGRKKDLD